ncbi:response regulator [Granulosicoccus sp.]|nr:response regulator [Granulosicoccus sp.]MDB4223340.1 response regulator [Granulosicoccus sp.]
MKNILLVEDDRKLSVALSLRLNAMGFSVSTATDATCAMGEVLRSRPDAMLIDINLPGGNGFLVADRVRALNQVSATPLIFITASKKSGLRDRADQYDAVEFLEKPFGAAELALAIDKCLGEPADFKKRNV